MAADSKSSAQRVEERRKRQTTFLMLAEIGVMLSVVVTASSGAIGLLHSSGILKYLSEIPTWAGDVFGGLAGVAVAYLIRGKLALPPVDEPATKREP